MDIIFINQNFFYIQSCKIKADSCKQGFGRMPSDGKSSHGLWPGELKITPRTSMI
jgi:hypothetical protein